MRIGVLLVPLSLLGCQDALTAGERPDGGGPPPATGRPVNGPITSPPGFLHLPNGTKATTLYLQPDGIVRFWVSECDSTGLSSTGWQQTSTSTLALQNGSSLTFLDGGTALVDPPLYPQAGPGPEIWQPGAACSVCMPGHPMAVVGCPTPDAGPVAQCCSGGCGGGVAYDPTCTFALLSGERPDAVAAGNCVCPVGTVSAGECTAYPKVFCGGQ